MKAIPMTGEIAALIGRGAEKVENPSLLFDRFAIPKHWIDCSSKIDEAGRWTIMRIAENGLAQLQKDRAFAQRNENKQGEKGEKAKASRQVLDEVMHTVRQPDGVRDLRATNTIKLEQLLKASRIPTRTFRGRLASRLAINLSDGVIENGGIALDRLTGAPYIPGSALKGCARHAALHAMKAGDSEAPSLSEFVAIFGATKEELEQEKGLARFGKLDEPRDQKGGVVFLPAHAVDRTSIVADITNVHTPDYYAGSRRENIKAGSEAGLRKEKPRPNPFPTVEAGGTFLFALTLNTTGQHYQNTNRLIEKAHRFLLEAVTIHGIGAKTAAGYGWFNLVEEDGESTLGANLNQGVAAAIPKGDFEEATFEAICNQAFDAGQRQHFVTRYKDKLLKTENKEWCRKFITKTEAKSGKSIRKMREKSWYLELKNSLEEDS